MNAPAGSTDPGRPGWRAEQLRRALAFASGSVAPTGFAWLAADGGQVPEKGLPLWVTARMTYVFSLAALLGAKGAPELAGHGVAALSGPFRDGAHGGWFRSLAPDGSVADGTKACYEHDFVLLAAATAQVAEVAGAQALLGEAAEVHSAYFWDDDAGRCRESWTRDWGESEDYRGANSNMHAMEAYLVTADVTGDRGWRSRALSIATRLVHEAARAHEWRVVEHFGADWEPLPGYNADRPADPFRPFGATPGHGLEWARLLVQLEAALGEDAHDAPWLVEAAKALFDRAVRDGTADGRPGLCYTTDWKGRPLVRERFHWVLAEALQAAVVLARRTGDTTYDAWAQQWWELADRHFSDRTHGSWHHELSPEMDLSTRVWEGKPDAYHVVNALLTPSLPLTPTAAVALRTGGAGDLGG